MLDFAFTQPILRDTGDATLRCQGYFIPLAVVVVGMHWPGLGRSRPRLASCATAGLDFGLTVVAELRSRFYAECTQLVAEYDPAPPFNAGSLQTAPAAVKADMVKLLADFKKKAEALAAATIKGVGASRTLG